jgi:hypothetical protein
VGSLGSGNFYQKSELQRYVFRRRNVRRRNVELSFNLRLAKKTPTH